MQGAWKNLWLCHTTMSSMLGVLQANAKKESFTSVRNQRFGFLQVKTHNSWHVFCMRWSLCLFWFIHSHSSSSLIAASALSFCPSFSSLLNSSPLADMPPLSVVIRKERLTSMHKQSTNAEVEMSSGLVIEPLSAGCTLITYYSANNNEVKHECDLGWLATLKGERREEASRSSS